MFKFYLKLYLEKALLKSLIFNELKSRYHGSILGITWAFLNPLITVGVLWFVFSMGFRAPNIGKLPYLLWLLSGMIPWFFLADSISSSTYSVLEKSFLVKKILFDVSLLPMVKIGSALLIHLFFIVILYLSFILYGFPPKLIWFQIFYYTFAGLMLVQSLAWITSSVVIFVRDLSQVVGVAIQFAFWLTPIFWSFQTLPKKYHWLIQANPLFYIINGYRETLTDEVWFWQNPELTAYFWIFTLVLFYSGNKIFRRLKPHFADLL